MPRSKNKSEGTPCIGSEWVNETHTGKGKDFHEGSSFFACLLNEDLDSRYGVYCRHCQSPAHIPSAHTVPRYSNHFLLQAPEKCYLRAFSGCRSLAQAHLNRQARRAGSHLLEQPSTNDQWELVFNNLCFLVLWVGHLCSLPSHTGPSVSGSQTPGAVTCSLTYPALVGFPSVLLSYSPTSSPGITPNSNPCVHVSF